MSTSLTLLIAAFRNRARTRLVALSGVLATQGAGTGALLREATLLKAALAVLNNPWSGLPEARLRVLLERLGALAGLWELPLASDPAAPGPLPAPAPAPVYVSIPVASPVLASRLSLTGITEFRDRFGESFAGSVQEFAQQLMSVYQAPSVADFIVGGQAGYALEVGLTFGGSLTAFAWSTNHPENVTPGSGILRELATNADLPGSGSGIGSVSFVPAAVVVTPGLVRQYQLTLTNTQGNTLSADVLVQGYYRTCYGPTATAPATGSDVRALPLSLLIGGGMSLTLNTGTVARRFALWLPSGRHLSAASDLDALGADLTGQYVASAFSAPDAAGQPVAGTLYLFTQAVPYASSHRHQLTIS